jgi:hypothetical protein
MKKEFNLSTTQKNMLKPIFILAWPLVIAHAIVSDLVGSLSGNRDSFINHKTGKGYFQDSNKNWIDHLGDEVFSE